MTWLRVLASRLVALFRRGRVEQELDEEVRSHLEMLVEENLRKRMSPEEARCAALRSFGGVEQVKEIYRERRGLPMIETLFQDVRYGLRMLTKNPGFTAVAVGTLALGIGANTAIFSVINAFMLRMIPVKSPDQLVLLSLVEHSGTGYRYSFSYPAYQRFQELKQDFAGILACTGGAFRLKMIVSGKESSGTVEQVNGEGVSGNYFSVLGVPPVLGRPFTAADDRPPEGQPVTIISFDFWKRRFGLDPTVVGRNIALNGTPFTIIGIAPPRFDGIVVGEKPDLWWPLYTAPRLLGGWSPFNDPDNWWLVLIGRLQPGANALHARAGLDVEFHQVLNEILKQQWAASMTPNERQNFLSRRVELEPGATGISWLREKFARPLLVLMAAVGLVLLIACSNVANLLLARASARQRETAVRLALGAGRGRLIRQLLTESVLLALMGGTLGLLLAYWGGTFLVAFMGGRQASLFLNVSPDPRVLGFTFAASVLTGMLFGMAPALRATRVDLTPALKGITGAAQVGHSRLTLGKALVVSQVVLSVLLLVGAGLLARTLEKLRGVDKGFDQENLLLLSVDSVNHHTPRQVQELYQRLFERLETLPGTRSVSYSQFSLMSGNIEKSKVTAEGYTSAPNEDLSCYRLEVGPRFLETMGIPVLLGRDFTDRDLVDVERTISIDEKTGEEIPPPRGKTIHLLAVINEAMAQYFFGSRNPIGRHFGYPETTQVQFDIVGVVKDAKYSSLREGTVRTFYLLWPWGFKPVELRTFANASTVVGSLPRVIHEVDPNLLVRNVRTMQDVVDETLIQERFTAQLSGFFSLFALSLACIGLYGVLAYAVTRRTNEIGIRLALGADRHKVLWMILQEGLELVLLGVVLGIPLALAAARLLSSMLFGLKPSDPVTLLAAALAMMAVATIASYVPGRKASQVDPMVALRYE